MLLLLQALLLLLLLQQTMETVVSPKEKTRVTCSQQASSETILTQATPGETQLAVSLTSLLLLRAAAAVAPAAVAAAAAAAGLQHRLAPL